MDYDLVVACGTQLSNLQQLTQLRVSLQGVGAVHTSTSQHALVGPLQRAVQCSPMLQHVVLLECGCFKGGEVVPSPLPGLRVTIQGGGQDRRDELAVLRPRQLRPLPHLAGVWEVDPYM
jgi:hypothetical protein